MVKESWPLSITATHKETYNFCEIKLNFQGFLPGFGTNHKYIGRQWLKKKKILINGKWEHGTANVSLLKTTKEKPEKSHNCSLLT